MTRLDIGFEADDNGRMSMEFVTEALKNAGFKNARCYSIQVEQEEQES